MLIEEVLYHGTHSLIDQSLHSRLGRGDDERRRVRHRLVRRRRQAGRLPQHRAGLERPEPSPARRARALAARVRAHPRVQRDAGAADELPSVPPRALAVDAQRADRRLPPGQARSRPRDRPVPVPGDRRVDRLGGVLLPRIDLRARGRSARGGRAGRRLHRGDRAQVRRRAADPDDGRDDRRGAPVGVPLLERAATRARSSSAPASTS